MYRVAIVTGGAGAIGEAISRRLSTQGYRVVVADLDGGAADRVAEEIRGYGVALDVRDLEQNRAVVAEALHRYGRLDLAALHAGINSEQRATAALDEIRYRRTVGVNVDGVVFGIDAAVPAMSAHGGTIVVTCSMAALAPEFSNPMYTLTKSAILGYVRAMANPLRQYGITINAICPSFVDTPMLGRTRQLLREQNFPLLSPQDVATTLDQVAHGAGSGEAWTLVAGRPAAAHEFPAAAAALRPDGSPATLHLPPPSPMPLSRADADVSPA